MAKTIIIVEDNNDKYTFEAIINFMRLQNSLSVNSSEPVNIEWKILSAESNPFQPNGLITTLKSLINDINKGKYSQIGIIWDLDILTVEQRIEMIKLAINRAYPTENIVHFTSINEFGLISFSQGTSNQTDIRTSCHFVGLNDKGEIEDLLKAIKSCPSPLADCIESKLPQCLQENHLEDLRDKDMIKLWINNYQRYDTLTKDKRIAKFTKWENVMKDRSDIFDFGKDSVPELVKLKEYLLMVTE
jgi:hypothetical protein